jgi:hypothetical protein
MRRDDWLARLWAEIGAAETRPFSWGRHDCCKFAARCVEAVTGEPVDLPYDDKASALRYLAAQGGIAAAVTARYGEPGRWWHVQRGDLCLVETPDGIGSLGVCMGPTIACVREDCGLAYVPLDAATACWRIE